VIRLALRVRRAQAELVLAELLDLAPDGFEEVDAGDGVVEYAIYGAPGELPRLPALRAVAGDAFVEVATSELPDDWAERWRRFHRPVLVAAPAGAADVPALRVRPPWEAQDPASGALDLVIDPGQAFGTGSHPTTRLCLELMLALAGARAAHGPLVDVGCGSGVLAIAAAKLAWSPVIALDNDPESVRATLDNARANEADLQARRFDLRRDELPPAATLVANLLAPLLSDLARRVGGAGPPEHVIAGGLLDREADAAADQFAAAGLHEHERRSAGGWAALLLRRDR
jgi:ribosomal protein L11 methyltransferase